MARNPNRLGLYEDVKIILDATLAAGGGTYTCPSHNEAVHWRQRVYRFRKLWAEVHNIKNMSRYDKIVLPKIHPPSPVVELLIRQQIGVFKPADSGIAVDLELNDDLLADALRLSAELDGDE